jgi:hypothetical protein
MIYTADKWATRITKVIADGKDLLRDCYLIDTIYCATECLRRDARGNLITNMGRTELLRERRVHRRLEIHFADHRPKTVIENAL